MYLGVILHLCSNLTHCGGLDSALIICNDKGLLILFSSYAMIKDGVLCSEPSLPDVDLSSCFRISSEGCLSFEEVKIFISILNNAI